MRPQMTKRPPASAGAAAEPGLERVVQALARLAAAHEDGAERPLRRRAGRRREARGVVAVAMPQQAVGREARLEERAGDELGRAEQVRGGGVLALLAREPGRVEGVRGVRVDLDAEPSMLLGDHLVREARVRVRALEQRGKPGGARRLQRAQRAGGPAVDDVERVRAAAHQGGDAAVVERDRAVEAERAEGQPHAERAQRLYHAGLRRERALERRAGDGQLDALGRELGRLVPSGGADPGRAEPGREREKNPQRAGSRVDRTAKGVHCVLEYAPASGTGQIGLAHGTRGPRPGDWTFGQLGGRARRARTDRDFSGFRR